MNKKKERERKKRRKEKVRESLELRLIPGRISLRIAYHFDDGWERGRHPQPLIREESSEADSVTTPNPCHHPVSYLIPPATLLRWEGAERTR